MRIRNLLLEFELRSEIGKDKKKKVVHNVNSWNSQSAMVSSSRSENDQKIYEKLKLKEPGGEEEIIETIEAGQDWQKIYNKISENNRKNPNQNRNKLLKKKKKRLGKER